MALSTEVTDRIDPTHLANITRFVRVDPMTIDTTKLDKAVADIEAEFVLHANVEFDDTNTVHVAVGVAGVVLLLEHRKHQNPASASAFETWRNDHLIPVKRISFANRIVPKATTGMRPESPAYQEHKDVDAMMRSIIPRGSAWLRSSS